MTVHLFALIAEATTPPAGVSWIDIIPLKARELTMSGVLVVLLLVLRYWLIHRFLRHDELPGEVRRRLVVNTRNATLLALMLGLILIWGSELQSMAISLFAVAAALVLATKEVIMCISGAFVRAQMYSVGDRIQIKDKRGDVIDKSVLTTRLLEIGPGEHSHQYTGRMLVVPNSELLSGGVANETALGDYLIHIITIPLHLDDDWRTARDVLLQAARAACAGYLQKATDHLERLEMDAAHYTPSAEPRVSLELPEPGRINLLLRLPVPKGRKQRIQQIVLNDFLGRFQPAARPQDVGSDSRRSGSLSGGTRRMDGAKVETTPVPRPAAPPAPTPTPPPPGAPAVTSGPGGLHPAD
ncbi:MAG: mechanosensitive ion channel domain-containing protein [Planctomycetota bacterium]